MLFDLHYCSTRKTIFSDSIQYYAAAGLVSLKSINLFFGKIIAGFTLYVSIYLEQNVDIFAAEGKNQNSWEVQKVKPQLLPYSEPQSKGGKSSHFLIEISGRKCF